jgi:uracil-xanthine permease
MPWTPADVHFRKMKIPVIHRTNFRFHRFNRRQGEFMSTSALPEEMSYFPHWKLKTSGVIMPEERLPWGQTIVSGLQHGVAMAGGTIIAPLIMGFDPNLALFFSGVGTLIFFVVVGGRVPSYLGSSFSFIAVVIAASGYSGHGPNANLDVALGGIIAAGVVYGIIALIVMWSGVGWVEVLMPPVVTGAVVAVIGLNLAPVAIKAVSGSQYDTWIGLITVLIIGLIAVAAPGLWRRLPIIIGAIAGYLLYLLLANGFGWGKPIDYTALAAAPWVGLPKFTAPSFHANAMFLIAPVAIILVAENLGHIKAVGAMTGRSLDAYLGRAFLGDSIATIVSAAGGGTGVTTYAENIGVMAATKVYSSLLFVVAAVVSILLGFSPKFGALILSIPGPVIGGLSIVLFGLIAAMAGRIWVENRVDFANPRNLITVAAALTAGAGDLTLKFGDFTMGGIGTATFGAIILYQILGWNPSKE